jgi:hypothetical protein
MAGPNLQDLCSLEVARLVRSLRNISSRDVLELHALVSRLPRAQEAANATLARVISGFDGFRELCGDAAMREALGDVVFDRMLEQSAQSALQIAKIRVTGVVLEAADVPQIERRESTVDASSGRVCYPYAMLQRGVKWPADVDPDAREHSLSELDFISVLGMERAAFHSLPVWKQRDLKRKAALF